MACLGVRLLFSTFLLLALIQAVCWALADIHYREFRKAFRQLSVSTPGTAGANSLASKAGGQIQRSIALAPDNAVYRRARGQLDGHLQSAGFGKIDGSPLKPDAESSFILAAQKSPTWEMPYLDLARLCVEQASVSIETYAQKCQPLFKTATELNPTYAYPHEQWATSLAKTIDSRKSPPEMDISRLCNEFGQAINLQDSRKLWPRAYATCTALTRKYRFLRLLKPSTAPEWSDISCCLAQDNVELWRKVKDDFLADLQASKYSLRAYTAVAETLAKLGFTKEGERVLTSYLDMTPRDANAWRSLIRLTDTYGLGFQDEKIKQMTIRALASADYDASAWLFFARVLFKKGDNKHSAEVFRQGPCPRPLKK